MPKIEETWEDFVKSFKIVSKRKTAYSYTDFAPADLADLFADIEINDKNVERVWLNARTFSVIRKWGRDLLDAEVRKEFLQKGVMGTIWGAQIVVCAKVPEKTIWVVGEKSKDLKNKLDEVQYASVLETDVDIPNSKALIMLNAEFKKTAQELQSMMNHISKKIESMIKIVEKNINN